MSATYTITWLDLLVAGIFLYFILRGAWTGFMRQLAALLALVGSYVVAAQYMADLIPYTKNFIDNPKLVFLATFLFLFFVSALMFSLMGRLLHRLMQFSMLGWFNRLLGVAVGVVKATLLVSLLYMVLASTLSATNAALRSSWSAPYLRQGSQILQDLINDPEVRDYFKENTPALPLELMDPEKQGQEKSAADQQSTASPADKAPAPGAAGQPAPRR